MAQSKVWVSFPIENGDVNDSFVNVYERVATGRDWYFETLKKAVIWRSFFAFNGSLWKLWKSGGTVIPKWIEKKHVPNHQPVTNQLKFSSKHLIGLDFDSLRPSLWFSHRASWFCEMSCGPNGPRSATDLQWQGEVVRCCVCVSFFFTQELCLYIYIHMS